MEIKVLKSVLDKNEEYAAGIRTKLEKHGIAMFNLIGSPGSGKTSLLEKTLPELIDKYRVAAIEGDIETDRDALRLKQFGIPVVLVNTGGSCHLNSKTIENAINELDLCGLDIIFIENVGNMVCPSEFDLGEDEKIGIISVTEGDDKPGKYPLMFREAGVVILNKIDLIDYTNFSRQAFYRDIHSLNPALKIFECSCFKDQGIENWAGWLKTKVKR